jgi:hypothetical protein
VVASRLCVAVAGKSQWRHHCKLRLRYKSLIEIDQISAFFRSPVRLCAMNRLTSVHREAHKSANELVNKKRSNQK